MTDVNPAATATDPNAKGTKKSERIVLDSAGKPQDDWLDAYGISYKSVPEDFTLTVMFDELPDPVFRALAAFGALTAAGNATNRVRNDKDRAPDATEKAALLTWLENLQAGNWTSPTGEVEAGVSTLAEAYARVLAKAGKESDLATVTEKLKAASKETRKAIKSHPDVRAAFTAIMAERAAAKAANSPAPALIEL